MSVCLSLPGIRRFLEIVSHSLCYWLFLSLWTTHRCLVVVCLRCLHTCLNECPEIYLGGNEVTLLWLCCLTLENSLPLSGPCFFHLLCKLFKSASLSFSTLCQRCASFPLGSPPLYTQRKARDSRSSREDSGCATRRRCPRGTRRAGARAGEQGGGWRWG